MENNIQYELIVTILNQGYAEKAMDAARKVGARGGTILTARGTATKKLEKKYNFVITPEKEILLILTDSKQRNDIMKSIIEKVGLTTKGSGITFSIPVDEVLGLSLISSIPSSLDTNNKSKSYLDSKYDNLYISTGSINETAKKDEPEVIENEAEPQLEETIEPSAQPQEDIQAVEYKESIDNDKLNAFMKSKK
ncbi:MAG: P-II family nitrogen regulator [Clostridia bacterium]|nr:P-II family nitrogen regulator [Clostridia bacterium]